MGFIMNTFLAILFLLILTYIAILIYGSFKEVKKILNKDGNKADIKRQRMLVSIDARELQAIKDSS